MLKVEGLNLIFSKKSDIFEYFCTTKSLKIEFVLIKITRLPYCQGIT
jgi:hypothetical protein